MKILITGASGFIGRALGEFIRQKHPAYQVFGISRRYASPNQRVLTYDLLEGKKLFHTLSKLKPDYIFHLAGGRKSTPEEIFRSNFLTTQLLFETIEEIPKYQPRIVIPGTAAEYGRIEGHTTQVSEKMPAKPVTWYGFVKNIQTNFSLMYARRGMNIIIARMFNISGMGVPSTLVIGKFAEEISQIEKGRKKSIIHTKNLDGKRDFLDIEDIVTALFALIKSGQSGEVYNVCSGHAHSIKDLLLKMISFSTKRNISIHEDKKISSESYDVIGSNRKIKKTILWKPQHTIVQSLINSLNYYRYKL